MRKLSSLLKLSILFSLGALMYLVSVILEVNSSVKAHNGNIFIASEDKIAQQAQVDTSQNINAPYLTDSSNNLSDFQESTITKEGFYLRIDKINLFKGVVRDVDPRYKEEYVRSWEKGISHGKFTATPDQIGITYLFAHAVGNSKDIITENAWFSELDHLVSGDEVIIYYNGMKYIYEVTEIRFVNPDATGFYTGVSPVAKVRMQFCGPPTGSLQKRTLVDAILVDSYAF